VTLAAPNHGVGDWLLSCRNSGELDRTLRQLCAGQVATLTSGGQCNNCQPGDFSTNTGNDRTFISDLNGRPLDCNFGSNPLEALHSRPAQADGILYLNLMAHGDGIVGDNTQSGDCAGRRLARNLGLDDAHNQEFNNVPVLIHENVPHHFEIICAALRTVTDHQAPAPGSPCSGVTHP
jgi:hypothetical protein